MKRIITLGILATLVGGFHEWSPAHAGISHVFGNGGDTIHFDAACHRPSWAAPDNLTLKQGQSVVAQQARCLVRRPTFAACVYKLGPAPTTKRIRKDDWTNVDKIAAYQQAIYKCSKGRF